MGAAADGYRLRAALLLLVASSFACGALGAPFLEDEVPFESVERTHFDAVGVVLERAPARGTALELRIHVVGDACAHASSSSPWGCGGDAADASIAEAAAWLRAHADIILVSDVEGAPLFLTRGDLAATSGRGTLGATVPEGMAAEVSDERVAPCVVAHEILHFVGLKHVKDRRNIMYAHCSRDFLQDAQIEEWQLDALSTLGAIRATTPSGVHVWASRD